MINAKLRAKLEELINQYGYDQVIDSMPPKKVISNQTNIGENRDDAGIAPIVRDTDILDYEKKINEKKIKKVIIPH